MLEGDYHMEQPNPIGAYPQKLLVRTKKTNYSAHHSSAIPVQNTYANYSGNSNDYAQGELDTSKYVKRSDLIHQPTYLDLGSQSAGPSHINLSHVEREELEKQFNGGFENQSPHRTTRSPNPRSMEKARRRLDVDSMTTPPNGPTPGSSRKRGLTSPYEDTNSPAERTTGGARMENSLLVLTRKFVNVLQSKPTVNLNDAAIEMGVPKRRLYDITNVFEGIDLIHKIGKNSIAIKKGMLDPELDPSTSSSSAPSSERALKLQQLEELTQRSSDLDVMLQSLLNAVQLRKENPVDRTYTYVSHADLRNLPGMEDKTLIAISAQWDTGFSVVKSDFSKTQRNEVKIRNDHGKPMTTLLCPNDDNGVAQHLGQDNEVAKQGYYPATPASNPVGLDGLEPLTKRRAFEPVTPTAQGVQHQPQFAYAYEQSHQSGVPVQMQENDFVMPSSSHNMKPSDTQLITPSKVLSPGRDMGLLLPSPIKTLTDPYSSVSSMGSMGWSNDELMSAHMDMEDPYQLSSDMLLDGIYQESDAWKL